MVASPNVSCFLRLNQTERWVLYACSLQKIQLTRYLQSFIKFVQKVCFPFDKKNQKNTQDLTNENCCNQNSFCYYL